MKSWTVRNILGIFSGIALVFLITGCRQADAILPKALYYINGTGSSAQLWRLEVDGVSRSQLTDEPSGADGFSVSPVDGTLAIISENKLHLINPQTQERQVIADGGLIDSVDHPSYTSQVSNPKFSPDGKTLAYSWNGIHLFDISTGADNHILPNPTIINGTAQDFAKGAYSVGAWSPDGSRLIVVISYYEGCTLAIMEPGVDGNLLMLQTQGAVGCFTAWSEDGKSVLAANPYLTGAQPGLWRYDAGTGQQTLAITRDDENQTASFAGWPFQAADGTLNFFHANIPDSLLPEEIKLTLVRLQEGAEAPLPIHNEDFQIRTALWAPDGGQVLVVADRDGTGRQLFFIDLSSGMLNVLIEDADQISRLVWAP